MTLIKNLHLFQGDGSQRLYEEFPMKNWNERRAWYTAEESKVKQKHWLNLTWCFNSVFAPELAKNWNMTVLQSSAAMSLRCGGICNDQFVADLVPSLAVKEFWKSINISEVINMSRVFFLTPGEFQTWLREN